MYIVKLSPEALAVGHQMLRDGGAPAVLKVLHITPRGPVVDKTPKDTTERTFESIQLAHEIAEIAR